MTFALDRDQQTRRVDMPEPGTFQVRAYRGGPVMPARIHRLEPGVHALRHGWSEMMTADVFGQPADPMKVWTYGWRVHPDNIEAVGTMYLDAVGNETLHV